MSKKFKWKETIKKNHIEKVVRDASGMIPISDKAKTKKYKHERKVKDQIKDSSFDIYDQI